ncbi:MAG: Stealth CR1 domain-containing protein [Lachnospiraceae bacterium]|nr:Stealth CR1 domain-containing protein [Lachnospiraceae bacterium]
MENKNPSKIDIVVLWVDGNDPKWQKEKQQYEQMELHGENHNQRYRDFGLMPYWFRGMEENLDWIGKIYFVTWGHVPSWLNTEHQKLEIVYHEDIVPKEYLPLFNSDAIEIFVKNIKGLSEQFLYFNDDMFLMQKTSVDRFYKHGLPKDMLAFQPVVANESDETMPYITLNNAMSLAHHFKKREGVKAHPSHYFHIGYPLLYFFYNLLELGFPRYTAFYTVHGPSPMLKSVYEEVWEKEREALERTARHRFRSKEDISQYLFREWAKLSGKFVPYNSHKDLTYFNLGEKDEALYNEIQTRKNLFLCINDSNAKIDFEGTKIRLKEAFEVAFPQKSSFEK